LDGYAQRINSRHSGIYNITELGYLSAGSEYVNYAVRLRTIFGYFITPKISAGVGFGLDGYHDPFDYNTAPLFLDVRGYLKDEPKTPFVFLNLGKSLAISEIHETGFFASIGVGYQRRRLVGSIGYNLQKIDNPSGNLSFNAIAFNLGLIFWAWHKMILHTLAEPQAFL